MKYNIFLKKEKEKIKKEFNREPTDSDLHEIWRAYFYHDDANPEESLQEVLLSQLLKKEKINPKQVLVKITNQSLADKIWTIATNITDSYLDDQEGEFEAFIEKYFPDIFREALDAIETERDLTTQIENSVSDFVVDFGGTT